MIVFLLLTYSILSALGMVLMKIGGKEAGIKKRINGLIIDLDYRLFWGIVMYFMSFIFWIMILKLFPVVYISPIAYGINFLFIVLLSSCILKEKLTLRRIIGAIIIIIGVILASIKL